MQSERETGGRRRDVRGVGVRLLAIKGLLLAFGIAGLAGLGGCSISLDDAEIALKSGTVRDATVSEMARLDMDRAAPIVLRIYKEESVFEVWKQTKSGKYALLKDYKICRFSGKLGPKVHEGDRQAPEGFYEISPQQMYPLSREHLAFNIGYPNAFDRANGHTGSLLMVHGGCASIGCYAMTNPTIDEIYGLIDEAFSGGQDRVPLEAFPFRMTTENLTKHLDSPNAPFWAMLKQGSDDFLAQGVPPTVGVCGKSYVFNRDSSEDKVEDENACPSGVVPAFVAQLTAPPGASTAKAVQANRAPHRGKMMLASRRAARLKGKFARAAAGPRKTAQHGIRNVHPHRAVRRASA